MPDVDFLFFMAKFFLALAVLFGIDHFITWYERIKKRKRK
jgi:hypothetical protein